MPEVNGQTDQVTKVQLKSYMLDCFWGLSEVAAGGKVPLEVRTAYVGDGSDIKVTVKDAGGGTVDTLKGKVLSNYFRAQYPVKPNNTGGIFFEAEMSAHSLKRSSKAIKVLPPVKMSDFKMEDSEGNPIKEINDQDSIKMSVKLTGPKEGTEAMINLYAETEKNQRTTAFSTTAKVESGKVEAVWKQNYAGEQDKKKTQSELSKDGETYSAPKYFFGVTCLGTEVLSDPVDYSGWITLNFSNVKGKVTYELPDGTKKTVTIPDDGILKIKDPKVGKVQIKDIVREKSTSSSGSPQTGSEDRSGKDIVLSADEIKARKDAKQPLLEAVTGQEYNVAMRQKAEFIESPDVLFNTNSACPCLDEEGYLLDVLVAVLKYSADNPDKAAVVFGHTDTSGDIEPNYKLSELRARAIKSLLDKDGDEFSSCVKEKSTVQDYQIILNTLTENHGWSCETGAADNQSGPKTESGVKNFQAEYNSRYKESLSVDGQFGPQSWKAVFRVLMELLEETWKDSGESAALPSLKYGYGGKGWYDCGESFPISGKGKDAYKSETNRRVEVMFFIKEEEPELKEPSSLSEILTTEECPVYDDSQWDRGAVELEYALKRGCISITLLNQNLKALTKETYTLILKTGEKISDESSLDGKIVLEGIPIGDHRILVRNKDLNIQTHPSHLNSQALILI